MRVEFVNIDGHTVLEVEANRPGTLIGKVARILNEGQIHYDHIDFYKEDEEN